MAREQGRKLIAQNRKARHDYSIDSTIEAGLVLTGTEVKSLRAGRATLTDGYATIESGEVWLRGVHIPEYALGTWTNHEPRRARKVIPKPKASPWSPLACTSRMATRRLRLRWRRAASRGTSGRPLPSVKQSVRLSEPRVVDRRAWTDEPGGRTRI